ncbi:MAG: polysaccharide pyruvyl transferase family protein, partial [Selenomonadaceae bacterium]|nr:polysaccharide pyruvyl transferase family protein [Selenomonadaceae bacterium]
KTTSWSSPKEILRTIGDSDLIIDISGYSLGSKWGMNNSRAYLNKMRFARALNVPIILMPQSFGPFDFDKKQKEMDKKIKDVMTYPEYIFVRELDGFHPLRKKYKLENVFFHPDLVLASPQTDPAYIYKDVPKISVPKVLDASCVAVVPNMRSLDRPGVNPWRTLQVYYEIINFLRKEGKLVYLFHHSTGDIALCSWLKSLFAEDDRVVLWEDNFSCFGYDAVCRQFDFMIVGRYHGIVHAYKNNIPCILMGWAVKYKELAQLMYQSKYFFDLAAPEFDIREIFSAIHDMENNLELNKKILRERLGQVQANSSCFVAVKKVLDKVAGRHSA